MNTIAHQQALARARARISAGWAHQPAHYSFYRRTPPEQAHIPFADEARRRNRRDLAHALFGAALFVAALAILVYVPALIDMWWGAPR